MSSNMYNNNNSQGEANFKTSFYNPFEVKHRKRTSRAQFKVLEQTFLENPKPNAAVRRFLAQKLSMTPRGVQVWFQNRRAKAKTQSKKSPSVCACADCIMTPTLSFDEVTTPTDNQSFFFPPPQQVAFPMFLYDTKQTAFHHDMYMNSQTIPTPEVSTYYILFGLVLIVNSFFIDLLNPYSIQQ